MLSKGRIRKNIYLSQADQREYMKMLREAAESGDVNAMGWMVMLSKVEGITPSPTKTSGWAGDDSDPKEAILAALRTLDPNSKQLPENQEADSE